eukprot:g4629.t1
MKKAAGITDSAGECVKVIVRVRPIFGKEVAEGRKACVKCDEENAQVSIFNPQLPGSQPKAFTFDHVYGPNSKQIDIYNKTASPLVDSVLEGFNGTIFAYGQTGSGKTFTMVGYGDPGIIPNAFRHIFDSVGLNRTKDKQYLVRASFLEIYNEDVRDLLSKDVKNKLQVKESPDSGVFVKGLSQIVVKNETECDNVLKKGNKNRSVGATAMNQTSSRSHSIFTVTVETSEVVDGDAKFRVGKLNLVDLAGSERQSKTEAKGLRLKEATKINLSLSALGNVISALVDGKSKHIPYRDSKLTRLLQDSLGGNTKTVMCANCGPADYNYDETVSTLRYANRAKNIKNKPKINEDPKDAMLREFQDEIIKLRKQLEQAGIGSSEEEDSSEGELIENEDGTFTRVKKIVKEKVVEKVKIVRKGVDREKLDELKLRIEEQAKELKYAAEKDRKRLRKQQKTTEKHLLKLQQKLREKEEEKKKRAAERAALSKKLEEVKAKVLLGGDILDRAAAQERELRRTQAELKERKEAEKRMIRNLAEQEEAEILMQQDYKDLHEEAKGKTAKLKKLYVKYQSQRAEIKDLQAEFSRERESILENIRELNKELKLKSKILELFIPKRQLERIESYATFDEHEDEWKIRFIQYSGNNQKRYKKYMKGKKLKELASKGGRPQSSRKRQETEANSQNELKKTFGPPMPPPYVKYDKNEPCGYSAAHDPSDFGRGGMSKKSNKSKKSKKKSKKRN